VSFLFQKSCKVGSTTAFLIKLLQSCGQRRFVKVDAKRKIECRGTSSDKLVTPYHIPETFFSVVHFLYCLLHCQFLIQSIHMCVLGDPRPVILLLILVISNNVTKLERFHRFILAVSQGKTRNLFKRTVSIK
jgi:hypothetical protein